MMNLLASKVMTYVFIGVIVVAVIVYMIFSSRQRKKQVEEDRKKKDAICAGTKVITIGGIVGTVVAVEESEFLLSSEGSVIRLDKRAIYQMELPEGAKIEGTEEKVEEKAEEKVEEVAPVDATPVTLEAKDGEMPVETVEKTEEKEEKPTEEPVEAKPAKKTTKKSAKK